jgi:hypothetical protein
VIKRKYWDTKVDQQDTWNNGVDGCGIKGTIGNGATRIRNQGIITE